MLTATSPAPNSQPGQPSDLLPRPAPTPTNWRGVAACYQEAKNAYADQSFEHAEALLLELIEFAPSETRAWKLLARTQKAMGNIRQAIDSATRALELQDLQGKPTDIPASATLARLLWQQGECDEARAMLGLLLLRQPDNTDLNELKQQWSQEASA